jgi:hypothetical protein
LVLPGCFFSAILTAYEPILNKTASRGIRHIVKFIYFKGWDWIIGVDAPEADFLVVRDKYQLIFKTYLR